MFTNAMLEYLSLGHAELVSKSDLNKAVELTYYVPIHMVIKDSSTTTRYRPVFDASTQTTTGVSLNDLLLAGPSLYPLLNSLIHQFREHTVVFTGDISKMFRGIHLAPQERDYHCFLLRREDNIIRDYRMNRLTFGVKSSPFLATRDFYVSVPTIPIDKIPTKRLVASAAAKVFHLMGWFGPVHSYRQELWRLKLDWDSPIPEDHLHTWKQWSSNISSLSNIPVPRHLSRHPSPVVDRQLHLFTDASDRGYGGVIYLRLLHQNTSVSVCQYTC